MKEKKYYSRLNITTTAYPLYTLLNDIRNCRSNGLDISPDYQRGYIWSSEYKDKLLLSLILNYPIGNIVINQLQKPNEKNAKQELVDGKQRLTTILNFVSGDYVIKSVEIDEIKGTIKTIMKDEDSGEIEKLIKKKSISYNDLPNVIKNNILAYNIPLYTIQSANTVQIREYFKVLQNQEKLRAGEIINSMPDNVLESYFNQIGNEFLERIDYSRLKRSEFEKLYYSVIAMVFNKLPLNSPDKAIVRFVEKIETLEADEIKNIEILNNNLNYIKNNCNLVNLTGMNKRTLKYILCTAVFIEDFFRDNTIEKLLYIVELSKKLASFNSSSSDNDSFTRYFGKEYLDNKEEFIRDKSQVYRVIYEISNRASKFESVKNAMGKLKDCYEEQVSGK